LTISDKTRKQLWGKSGNRCAICKKELFTDNEAQGGIYGESSFNIGEECHIISKKKEGPRYIGGLSDYDIYENLVLLCRNHHKEVDTLTTTYTEELIRYIKTSHEKWVKDKLDNTASSKKTETAKFMRRVISGKELLNILDGAHGYRIDYDEPDTDEEHEYIGGILQALTDYGDLIGMISQEQGEKVKISIELKKILVEIENNEYFLFVERESEPMSSNSNNHDNWEIVTLLLKKSDNENIIKL